MKTEFKSILPFLVSGMDGSTIIPANVASVEAECRHLSIRKGDAVDMVIYALLHDAEECDEPLSGVVQHIDYVTAQLAIFKRNLRAHLAEQEQRTAEETTHAKLAYA